MKPSVWTEQGGSRTSLNAPGFMLLTLEPNVFYTEKLKAENMVFTFFQWGSPVQFRKPKELQTVRGLTAKH